MNLLPELIKAACTVLGAYGESTLSSKLLHLRSLDWDAEAPIANYATVTVYHPNASYPGYAEHFHEYYKQQNYTSHAFANFGYVGLIGSLSAYSEASVGLGEKVWLSKEQDITSRFGNPWTYVLRDVVQFADSIDTALTMMVNAQRTCSIHLGLGSYTRNTNTSMINDEIVGFRGIEYSADEFNVFDWQDMFITRAHPQLKDVVYWDKHVQPSGNPCLGSLLVEAYGHLDPETIIRNITSLSQTGDALNLVLDYGENAAYIAYSAPDDKQGPLEAYNRVHTRLDMAKLFAEPAPK
jgi:exportin-7